MTVYIDRAEHPLGNMKMCHMLADTRAELFAMADCIGVDRKHYQDFSRASTPHFDIAKSKRTLAVAAGAVVVGRRELRDVLRRIKTAALEKRTAGEPHGGEP